MRGPLLALLLALLAAPAAAEEHAPAGEAPGAAVRVHDHVAFVFRAPDGRRTAAMRAAEATQNLSSVIDDEVGGPLTVQLTPAGDAATVQVGNRQIWRVVPADAAAAGAPGLAEYVGPLQTTLDSFLTKERRRAQLQKGVLSLSLVVFFGLLAYLLVRLVYNTTRRWEERLAEGQSPYSARFRLLGFNTERSRTLALFALTAGRVAAGIAAAYLFLLSSLSLFERTRPWRDRLAGWAAKPFAALGQRVLEALPNLLLLAILVAVVRGGWRAMSLGFDRMSRGRSGVAGVKPELVLPYRLLARAGLVVGALLLLPLVAGTENGILAQVGILLLAAVALALVPLAATVVVGTYALLTGEYRLGEWVSVRLPGGREISGEVTFVDFFHLRLVPQEGGEIRLPHLSTLWTAVEHLPESQELVVEVPVALARLAPAEALEALRQSAERVLTWHQLAGSPNVSLVEVGEQVARFRVGVPEGPEALRTELLLALYEATRGGRR